MVTRKGAIAARTRAAQMLWHAGIVLTSEERDAIEIADCGLGQLEREGSPSDLPTAPPSTRGRGAG
jgi:hypothetical protein